MLGEIGKTKYHFAMPARRRKDEMILDETVAYLERRREAVNGRVLRKESQGHMKGQENEVIGGLTTWRESVVISTGFRSERSYPKHRPLSSTFTTTISCI